MRAHSLSMLESQIMSLHAGMPSNKMPPPPLGCLPFAPNSPAFNTKVPKVPRWNLRDSDLQLLETAFSMDHFPSAFARERIANELKASCRQERHTYPSTHKRAMTALFCERNPRRLLCGEMQSNATIHAPRAGASVVPESQAARSQPST